jgi:hypothetical protein
MEALEQSRDGGCSHSARLLVGCVMWAARSIGRSAHSALMSIDPNCWCMKLGAATSVQAGR